MRIRNARLFFCSLCFILLSACATPSPTTDASPQPAAPTSMLESVPADTMLFVGGTEPMPDHALQVVIDGADAFFQANVHPSRPLHDIVTDSLGDDPSPSDLTDLGIARNPRVVLYAEGFNPVLRIDVSNAETFDAFVVDLAKFLSAEVENRQHEGVSFDAISADDMTLLARHEGGQAVLAVVAQEDLESFLPVYTGTQLPETSLADSGRFAKTRTDRGYEPFLIGFLDWETYVSMALDEQALEISEHSPFRPRIGQHCAETVRAASAGIPRVTFGFETFTEDEVQFSGHQALDSELVELLRKAAAPGIIHETSLFAGAFADFGVGARPYALAQQIDTWFDKLSSSEAKCAPFGRITKTTPPPLRTMTGIRVFLSGIGLSDDVQSASFQPELGAIISTDDARAFRDGVSMMLPIDLTKATVGGEPVELARVSQAIPFGQVFALIREGWMGISLGAQATAQLVDLEVPADASSQVAARAQVRIGALGEALLELGRARLEQARQNQDELGVSDEELATTAEYLDAIASGLPPSELEASLQVTLVDDGLALAYRRTGRLDYDFSGLNPVRDQARFNALRRVLRLPFFDALHEANVKEAKIELSQLAQMVNSYYMTRDPRQLPDTLNELVDVNLIRRIQTDPWGEPYLYRKLGEREFEIRSAGPDGEFDTDDDIVE